MDEETTAALNLTGEDLRAMRDAAEPGVVAKRPRDLNQRAASIVAAATMERSGTTLNDFAGVTACGIRFETSVTRVQRPTGVTVTR